MQSNYFIADDPLSLERIRSVLTRLEDTILFSLIERAQFAHNPRIYEARAFPELTAMGFEGSWLRWYLQEIETFHAKARRYTSPDEYPFTQNLPAPVLAPLTYPMILHPNRVNANASILSFYTRTIVPRLTMQATLAIAARKRAQGITGDAEFEDDGQHGSAATIDVEVLQAISKRVHYGKFVSESKFRSDPATFIPLIRTRDRHALEGLITKPAVERALLTRLRAKAAQYAVDFNGAGEPVPQTGTAPPPSPGAQAPTTALGKGDVVNVINELYELHIIPLTKEVEVDYLLQRLEGLSDEEVTSLMSQPQTT